MSRARARVADLQHCRFFHRGLSSGTSAVKLHACELRGKSEIVNAPSRDFRLSVLRMSRPRIIRVLDQYELAVDEIVAACDDDPRGALRALLLVNEQLER